MKFTPSHRPHWFVDIKWIVGILLFVALSACLLLFTAARLTDKTNGPKVVAFTVGVAVLQDDKAQDLQQQIRRALDHGQTSFRPVEGFPAVKISKADLNLSLDELKQKLFEPIAQTVYDKGLDGAAQQLFNNPKERKQFTEQASVLKIISPQTHDNIARIQRMLVLPVVVLLLLLIYFSAGWGRLVSPGLLFVLAGLPGALAGKALMSSHNGKTIGGLPQSLADQIGAAFDSGYGFVTRVGVILLLAALVGKVVTVILHRRKHTAPPKTAGTLPAVPEKKPPKSD